MAEVQELLDFPPAPGLGLDGKLDPKKFAADSPEMQGQKLFFGKAQCGTCHPAPFYTDNLMHDLKVERFYKTQTINDLVATSQGPIKTFVLRGIKESPPYFHDGRLLTLEDTVEFFNLVLETKLDAERKEAALGGVHAAVVEPLLRVSKVTASSSSRASCRALIFLSRRGQIEELGPINFRKFDLLTRFGGPFDFAQVAADVARVAVSLERPCVNDLAPFLLDRIQRSECSPRRDAGLFFELALGGGKQVFARLGLPFRNRPGPFVFVLKEWPAGMGQQHFQNAILDAIHQQAGTGSGHFWRVSRGFTGRGGSASGSQVSVTAPAGLAEPLFAPQAWSGLPGM